MAIFDYSWVNRKTTLKVECDLVHAWQKFSGSKYRFQEQRWLDFAGDRRIWLQVQVSPNPSGCGDIREQSFPVHAVKDWTNGNYGLSLRDGKLTVNVRVLSDVAPLSSNLQQTQKPVEELTYEELLVRRDELERQVELKIAGRARVFPDKGNLKFVWREPRIATLTGLDFEMVVIVVLKPSKGKEPPILKDWEKRFFPGGLPSLGKKR